MSGNEKRSTPVPLNAFAPDFLDVLAERDEPPTAGEAELAVPLLVEDLPGRGIALFAAGKRPERGHRPMAVFSSPYLALLAAAVLPSVGRDAAFRLDTQPEQEGLALHSRADWGEVVAHLELFDDKWIAALHVAYCLAVSPQSLAFLLEAVGGLALDRAGTILAERVTEPQKK